MISINRFLENFIDIVNEKHEYRHGGDGSNGYCDCIGAIIGAVRRSGGNWKGGHGSNYAARFEMDSLYELKSTEQLYPGYIVYKAYKQGETGYNLPDKYKQGGVDYIANMLEDYYHVGVVTSINPLIIEHMTSPTSLKDTKLGRWNYVGKLKGLDYNEVITVQGKLTNESKPYLAKVVTKQGDLNIRKGASDKTTKYDVKVPRLAIVEVLEETNSKYYKIKHVEQPSGEVIIGYVASEYLSSLDNLNNVADTTLYTAQVNTAKGALNIRSTADKEGKVIGKIPQGARINVIEESNREYYKIRYYSIGDGIDVTGYVAKEFLMRVNSENTTTTRTDNLESIVSEIDEYIKRVDELCKKLLMLYKS